MTDLIEVVHIMVPLNGVPPEQLGLGTGYMTIARATTPQGAGDVIRAITASWDHGITHIRIEVRKELCERGTATPSR